MQEGNAALARRDYKAAEQAAREVLASSRTSPRAYDAQFLLAQSMAGERQFPQAAIAYDDAYNRARKGAHAPGRLAGPGQFADRHQREEGCLRHAGEAAQRISDPRPDLRDAIAASTQRAGCR